MRKQPPVLPTIGQMSRQHNVLPHQVRYAIFRLGIEPAGRAGSAHVYTSDAESRIAAEIHRIAAEKARRDNEACNG